MINYEVFWDSGNGGDPRTPLTTTSNAVFEASTTLVIADLTDGGTYRFAVRAVNSIGESLYSDTLSVIAATVPGTPTAPSIVSASSASIQIEWDEPASGGTVITNYHVYEAEGETPADIDFALVQDTALTRSYTKSISVTPGQRYHFKVLAVNQVGESGLSLAVDRIAATIPNAPTGLATISQSTTQISFSWLPVANDGGSSVTDYAIWWNGGAGTIFSEKIASTGLIDPLQFTLNSVDHGIEANKDYSIQIKATNAVGQSAASASLDIISAEVPSPPGTPYRVSTTNQNQIVVGWPAEASTGGAPITEYEIWHNQGVITDTFYPYSVVGPSTYTETITGISQGDLYKVRIVARNRVGDSDYSAETTIVAATVPDPPDAPTRVVGTNTQTTIDLEWTPNSNGGSGITDYEIWWNGGGGGPATGLLHTMGSATATYQVTSLTPGTFYKFAIKAINIVGTSNASGETEIIAATIPGAPSTPTLVSQS